MCVCFCLVAAHIEGTPGSHPHDGDLEARGSERPLFHDSAPRRWRHFRSMGDEQLHQENAVAPGFVLAIAAD
jgi:hypothetical protein